MFDPDVEMPITQSRSTPMSDFTIEQLEVLKAGTTPGPWERFHETWEEYNPDGDAVLEYEQYGIIGGADGILDTLPVKSLMDAPNQWAESGEHDNAANTRLAAAAPALVDALIAEKRAHQELRKRIEDRIRELKQPLCSHMPEGDELDDYVEQWDRQSYEAAVLTRILEGDDEGDLNTGGFPW